MNISVRWRRQQGVVLVLTLVVLVAMTLAGLAMMRSLDTSTLIAGNLAFKQSATVSADAGVEAAIDWLGKNTALLNDNSAGNGYYATSQDTLDLTGASTPNKLDDNLDWSNAGAVHSLGQDAAGNEVSYVIHRMCNSVGQLDAATCATEQSAPGGNSQGSAREMLTDQLGSWDMVANRGFYRITVRVAGPRSNVSFVQAIISQ